MFCIVLQNLIFPNYTFTNPDFFPKHLKVISASIGSFAKNNLICVNMHPKWSLLPFCKCWRFSGFLVNKSIKHSTWASEPTSPGKYIHSSHQKYPHCYVCQVQYGGTFYIFILTTVCKHCTIGSSSARWETSWWHITHSPRSHDIVVLK